jgi:hypothetical protein
MYMKVIQACVSQNTNHRENDEDNVDMVIFLPRFTRLPSNYAPVVSTTHPMVWQLIGITRQARTSGTARTYLTSEGSSITRSTRVAFHDPCGVSTIPLTNPPLKHRTSFSCASAESQATKPSRRWQPPRVTSTTGLQDDHLVPLDVTSRCNTLESLTHSIGWTLSITSELEGSQALSSMDTKSC